MKLLVILRFSRYAEGMKTRYNLIAPMLLALALSGCEQNGGAMPIDGKSFLSTLDGPSVPTVQDTLVESAKAAEKKNDFGQAADIYRQILIKDGNNKDIILALADAVRRKGDYDEAISIYENLIKKDGTNLAAQEGKGLALLSKGDFETPTNIFLDVLKADGKRWKSLNAVGILFSTRNMYAESEKYFEEALRHNPSGISIKNNLGLVQALNKQYAKAVNTLLDAASNTSVDSLDRKRVELNLAMVYAGMGKLAEAEKIAREHLSGVQLSNNLGLYAHLAKDDQLAKSYLNMALTDSTVYYEKAWENLETLNNSKSDKAKGNLTVTDGGKAQTSPSSGKSDASGNQVKPLGKIKNSN